MNLTASADKLRGTAVFHAVSLRLARVIRFFRGLLGGVKADGCVASASSSVPSVPSDGEYSYAVNHTNEYVYV